MELHVQIYMEYIDVDHNNDWKIHPESSINMYVWAYTEVLQFDMYTEYAYYSGTYTSKLTL